MANPDDSDEAYSLHEYPRSSNGTRAPEEPPAEEDLQEPPENVADRSPEEPGEPLLRNPPEVHTQGPAISPSTADMMRRA